MLDTLLFWVLTWFKALACGPNLRILSDVAESRVYLTYLFQKSFKARNLPFDWTSVKGHPNFKCNDKLQLCVCVSTLEAITNYSCEMKL